MGGNATLGDNLIDSLIPDMDDLKAQLFADFGIRQYRVFVCRRQWSGTRRGETATGAPNPWTQTEIELIPPPEVIDNRKRKAEAFGTVEIGDITLKDVSLSYSQNQLTGADADSRTDIFYKVIDGQGQGARPQYYTLANPPVADRMKTIAWVIELNRAEIRT